MKPIDDRRRVYLLRQDLAEPGESEFGRSLRLLFDSPVRDHLAVLTERGVVLSDTPRGRELAPVRQPDSIALQVIRNHGVVVLRPAWTPIDAGVAL